APRQSRITQHPPRGHYTIRSTMHQPHHRPGAPAFLNTADQIIAFITEHQQSHRSVGRIGGECACGWTAPDNTVITVGDHAAAALIDDLAERLSTGWTDTDGTEFNWPDLVEHQQQQLDAAHHRMDTYQFRLAQLFEVAQTMRQAAKVLDDFIAERDAEGTYIVARSEEHTSELQSRENLVCRLLLEKKK